MKLIKHFKIFILFFISICLLGITKTSVYAATSPDLGTAASFAILGGTAVTNVPTSVITGDVGLSPAAGSNYSGLSTSEVSGVIYAVDSSGPAGSDGANPGLLTTAKTDLTTAYTALAAGDNANASCPLGYQFGAGNIDLSGKSLPPGLYCSDTFTLTGTLTLTGSGVWVFRSGTTLITSGTANVVGGDTCNVWWQVPSAATLGTNTSLIGNILALNSITMNTGARLTGRALARNAAVTLQSNTINQSCTAASVKRYTANPYNALASGNVAPCVDTQITHVPIIIDSQRISPTSISLNWGPYTGTDQFTIRYGVQNGTWLYSTNVTGFSTTLNSLPVNQPMWVQVAERNNCSVGNYSEARLIGGPGLPNTGFGPKQHIVSRYTPVCGYSYVN